MGFQSELVALVIIALLLAVISTLSSQLVQPLGSACGFIARKAIPLFVKNIMPSSSLLIDLVEPVSSIVKRMYKSNTDFYMKHYMLKSAADEELDQIDEISAHYTSVQKHINAIRDRDVVCTQAYQERMSQDQRKIENMEEELSVERSLLVILLVAFPVMLSRIWMFGFTLAILCGVTSLSLAIVALPSYVDRKRSLARFLLASYLDVFTVTEFSEYPEREGEPRL